MRRQYPIHSKGKKPGAPTYVHEQMKSSSTVSRLGKSKIADCSARVGDDYMVAPHDCVGTDEADIKAVLV